MRARTVGQGLTPEPIISTPTVGAGGRWALQQQTSLVCTPVGGIAHRMAHLQRTGPDEKCAEVPFPAGVLQFHPPHTKLGAGILGERLWESPTTEEA